jgi:hypothetical protein
MKNIKTKINHSLHEPERYEDTMKYAGQQILSDLRDKWFLIFLILYMVLFFISLYFRQKYPWIYVSFLTGLNALVIAWFGRLGLVFIPAGFVLFVTLERYYNLRF